MSIQDFLLKFKGVSRNTEYLLALLIVVVSVSSFALGRFSVKEENRPSIHMNTTLLQGTQGASLEQANTPHEVSTSTSQQVIATSTVKTYVASKKGTKYFLPWCGSASMIKEENKVWFATKQAAEAAGYSPAANCKGL